MEFHEFLIQRMQQLSLSLQDISTLLTLNGFETSKATVGHWRTGRNKPPLDQPRLRSALSLALEMDVNDMMDQLGYIVNEDELSPIARRIAHMVNDYPDSVQELALRLVQQLRP